ncbi:MAG: T9SS type A sorting domain-containing protein [bacterium]|nr:MAG: T9SS type A sorting domain-containing protein [bacterium]
MKRRTVLICMTILCVSIPASVLAWGAITHTYLAHELGNRWGFINLQEIYGATLPDMFNLMYGSPYKDYLWHQTHYEYMKVADKAYRRNTRAVAYGFTSHNDAWGADWTAHHGAITNPGEGYVITKVQLITPALVPQITAVLQAAGVPDAAIVAQALAPGLSENFVETAVDILVRRNEDPGAGYRLALAAQLRDFAVPILLIRAYVVGLSREFNMPFLAAVGLIAGAEKEYRDLMKFYGGIFTKSEEEAIDLLAEQGALLAQAFLKAETGYDVTVPVSDLADFLRNVAIPAVEPDYGIEIAATLDYLETAMPAHGFSSPGGFFLAGEEESSDMPEANRFNLAQNYPNPFNPTTVIGFTLSEPGPVKLTVYNVQGQEIAALVNRHLPAGDHSITWNAAGVPSGVYFCRLQAEGRTATRKMCLLR